MSLFERLQKVINGYNTNFRFSTIVRFEERHNIAGYISENDLESFTPVVFTDRNLKGHMERFVPFSLDHLYVLENPVPFFSIADEMVRYINSHSHLFKKPIMLVGFGSGTINDLCKYVSGKLQIPYFSIPTAASMNGYLSVTSSLIDQNNYKSSVVAKIPDYLYTSMELVSTAPKKMSVAGICDSLARQTAQCDYLLSCFVKNEMKEYRIAEKHLFDWSYDLEKEVVEKYLEGQEYLMQLFTLLLLGGLSMSVCNASFPASGSEHQIAHYLSTMDPRFAELLHGEQIASTLPISVSLQKKIYEEDVLGIRAEHIAVCQDKNFTKARYLKEKNFPVSAELERALGNIKRHSSVDLIEITSAIASKIDELSPSDLREIAAYRDRVSILDFC